MVVKVDRVWQSEGSGERNLKKQRYRETGNVKFKNFWLGVCGAAGKTYWCAKQVKTDIQEGVKLAIVLASYSAVVRSDHKTELLDQGVSATDEWSGEGPEAFAKGRFKGVKAIVITYSMMGKYHKELNALIRAFDNNVGVYFDEPHHLWESDGEKLTWGDHALNMFDNVAWRVFLTGTPFRTDSRQDMPFSETEWRLDNGEVVPEGTADAKKYVKLDYEYRFAYGVRDSICRAVEFHTVKGKVTLVRKDETQLVVNLDDEELDDKKASAALNGFINPDNDAVKEMIRLADDKLTQCRQRFPQAGGSIWTTRIEHAKKLAAWMEAEFGEAPVVVTGEPGEDGKKKLEEFKNSNARWLISVGMVTEGVNVPRLMVGVYAVNILTLLRFLQIVWRLTRRIYKDNNDRLAFCFIPEDPRIVALAQKLMAECAVGMDLIEDGNGKGNDADKTPTYSNTDAQATEGRTILQKDQVTTLSVPEERRSEAKTAAQLLSARYGRQLADSEALADWDEMVAKMAQARGGIVTKTPARAVDPDAELKRFKEEINTKVSEYGFKQAALDLCSPGEPAAAAVMKPGYNKGVYNSMLHADWIKLPGNHAQDSPLFGVEEAKKKLAWAKNKVREAKQNCVNRGNK